MFFCEPCRKKWRWPASMFKSKGQCEMCNRFEHCYDIPSSRLPDPMEGRTREDREDG